MKHTFVLFGMAGLAVVLFSSTAMAQKENEPKETKNTRHIKLVKVENGKKVELDTVVTGDAVFVWRGDTIGGKEIGHSGLGKMKHMNHFLPVPPVPPIPHMRMMKQQHSGRVIDLNDPNIISYRKKSMKGGREKIEIIRNAADDAEDMSFDFQLDDQFMPPPPPPPPAPEMIREFNEDNKIQENN